MKPSDPNPRPPASRCSGCGFLIPAGLAAGLCPGCALGGAVHLQGGPAGVSGAGHGMVVPGDSPAASPATHGRERRFGDYDLIEEVARGGMGIVYRAWQRSLRREVAVKLLLPGVHSSPEFIRRFRLEASAAAALQHPNIVAIHDVGVQDGEHFLVMDYVRGTNLAQVVRDGPVSPGAAARYLKAVAEAIEHAHQMGVLHRDLKPSNILIDADDNPRVTDFGLAKRMGSPSPGTPLIELTQPGQILGSPNYLPPEQAVGDRGAVGRGSDVYSLGAMLYHLLTGRPPFLAGSLAETLQLVREQEPVALRLLNPGVPRDLETVCLKCLEKSPGRRYQSAGEVARELDRYLAGEPIEARPVGVPERIWRWSRRNRLAATLLGFLGVTVVAVLILLTFVLRLWRDQRVDSQRLRVLARGAVEKKSDELRSLWSAPDREAVDVTADDIDLLEERPAFFLPAGRTLISWTMAVTAEEDPVARVKLHSPLLRELEAQGSALLGNPVRMNLRVYKFHEDFLHDLRTGVADMGRLGAVRYLRAQRDGVGLQPLVIPVTAHKSGVFFTRSDTGIRAWDDLRRACIAFGDTNATVSFWARIRLMEHGIGGRDLGGYDFLDPVPAFERMVHERGLPRVRADIGELHSHLEVIQAVREGSFDVGVANKDTLRPYLRHGLAPIPGTEFESSPTVLVAGPHLDVAHVNAIVQILTNLRARWLETLPEQSTGFIPAREPVFAEEESWFEDVDQAFPVPQPAAAGGAREREGR